MLLLATKCQLTLPVMTQQNQSILLEMAKGLMPTIRSKGIAVLLLDAENLQLSPEMEEFLQQQSSFQS
jgi:membrane protease subunit (stomatin/prohibitin family)